MVDLNRQEDPLAFLRLRVLTHASLMRVDAGWANEAVGIFVTALGADWLRRATADVSPSEPIPFRRHPLGDLVSTAGHTQISELFELGEYLRSSSKSPVLPALISGLRGDYHST